MKKKKKNKDGLFTKKAKRIKPEKEKKTKRIKKVVKSPYRLTIRDWSTDMGEHKVLELHEDSKLEISIDGKLYFVKINKKNRCLEFGTHETHLFLQPISVHQFLVKANTKKE